MESSAFVLNIRKISC